MAVRSLLRSLSGLLVLFLLPACAARGGVVGPEALLQGDNVARVQPGDSVALKVWRDTTMSGSFAVDADGRVFLPRFGALRVADRPIVALQDSLREAYAAFLRNPAIEVTVRRRIGVEGEVNEPGLYYVDLTYTLRDVILQAGGLTPFANPERILLLRGSDRIRTSSREAQRIPATVLRSGDQVVIGRRSWISMNPLSAVSALSGLVSLVVLLVR